MSDYKYPNLIPDDAAHASRRFDAVKRYTQRMLQELNKTALLRSWWAFCWLNPSLHPDDAEVWPEEVKEAQRLAAEAYARYKRGELNDDEYYPNEALHHRLNLRPNLTGDLVNAVAHLARSRGPTTLTWAALESALNQAGVILADDSGALYVDYQSKDPGDAVIHLKPFDDSSAYHVLREVDNPSVEAVGASVFVIADVAHGDEGQELQLSFYKTWVVADDLSLAQIK
jgi:hypothetical protein